MMMAFTYLPGFVTGVLRGLPTMWRGRHRLIFCWLVFIQAVHPGRHTLEEMARWTPATITAWRWTLAQTAYWNVHLIVSWLAQDLLATLPPPTNGVLYLFGDGSHADKRGTKNPVGQKGRISQHHPWFFGVRFVLLMAAWDGYRMPVGFRLILPKRHADYRSENVLFREMVSEFIAPKLEPELIIVGGDAAYGSKANMDMVKARAKTDTARRWGFVFAIARTWKTVEEKSIKHLVTHVPLKYYQCTRVPRAHGRKGRKTFWTYSTRLCLRHVGDVTVVLSKKGRNMSPQHTKILVTNLAELTPSQVVHVPKRWAIELLNWELKSGLGLGEHQVSGDTNRSEKSVGIAVLAYLLVLRVCHHEIIPGKPWVFSSCNMRYDYGS